MSIVFLNPVGTLGGAERSLLDVLAVLRELRPNLQLSLIAGADGPLLPEARSHGVSATVVEMPDALAAFGESGLLWSGVGLTQSTGLATAATGAALAALGYLRRLRRAVANARPRLIHSNGLKFHVLAGHASPPGCPVLWHVRDFLSTRPVLGRGLRHLAPRPALAVANSEAVAADTSRVLPNVRVVTVYNGIDTDQFSPAGSQQLNLDAAAGLPPAPPRTICVGLVGTYARWKGQNLFIEAAAEAVRRGLTGTRFYIVGGPVYSTAGSQFSVDELRAMIANRGMGDRFGLVPFQADLPPVYRALDVVVHASTRPEPFGRTIVEGMACGRAVVVALAGGAAEIITPGHDALGVEPNAVQPLVAAVMRLCDDERLRASLGAAARATTLVRFSRHIMGERLIATYESLGTMPAGGQGPEGRPLSNSPVHPPPHAVSILKRPPARDLPSLRVLYLSPIGKVGGAERMLLTALAGVKQAYPNAALKVVTLADGPLCAEVRGIGAECELVPLPPGLDAFGDSRIVSGGTWIGARGLWRLPALAAFAARLRDRIADFAPDVVHSNGIKTHLLSPIVVPKTVPLVWHAHDFYGSRPLAGWLLRRTRSCVGVVVAISNAVAADVRAVLPGVPVRVVPNAIDISRFCPGAGNGPELDRLAGVPVAAPGTVRVGLVATYARWKGHLTILDAAARLAAESPEMRVRWYIIGGPIYQTAAQFSATELREAAAARGLGDRLGFVPFADDPVTIYRSLDIVVHASTAPEPFGLTIAEAMACGRAVVVSAAGGATELFVDGVDAIGFQPGRVDQLVNVVRRLVKTPGLPAQLGRAARSSAEERFDATRYGHQLFQAYRSVLTRRQFLPSDS